MRLMWEAERRLGWSADLRPNAVTSAERGVF